MNAKFAQMGLFGGFLTVWVAGSLGGCTTAQVSPVIAPPPSPPPYLQVPHPKGTDMGDLHSIFLDPTAPSSDSMKTCEASYMKLRSLTESDDERRDGARELVRKDPVFYHWCFYSKIRELDESLKTLTYIDERQKKAIDTYSFLVPIARGFAAQFKDSRYLRWAVLHYKQMSEWVFFRKLELSAEQTVELVQVPNPFGLWRDPNVETSVLDKYNIAKPSGTPSPRPSSIFNWPKEDTPPTAPVAAAEPEVTQPEPVAAATPEPTPVAPVAVATPEPAPLAAATPSPTPAAPERAPAAAPSPTPTASPVPIPAIEPELPPMGPTP